MIDVFTQQFPRVHDKFEKRFAKIIFAGLSAQILQFPNITVTPIRQALERLYFGVVTEESKRAWNHFIAPEIGFRVKDMTDDIARINAPTDDPEKLPDFWALLMKTYLDVYLGTRVLEITNVTRKRIESLGLSPDLSETELRRALKAHARTQELRANTITRTETTTAINKSHQFAIESSRIPFQKAWVAMRDERTRIAHWDMNPNEFIPIEQPFVVGGELMNFPTDSSFGASAWNIVNCRCTVRYKKRGGNVGFRPVRFNQ